MSDARRSDECILFHPDETMMIRLLAGLLLLQAQATLSTALAPSPSARPINSI